MNSDRQLVLIVEDQEINRQILHHILQVEYDVIEAVNGREALAALKKYPNIAAILLDIVMPIMEGYEFLGAIKDTPFSTLPIIAVTGSQDAAAEQKALDLGAWDFVSKPYEPRVLMARLKNVIVRSQFYLINRMKHAYEHDQLTDCYNRVTFFQESRKVLDRYAGKQEFALLRFDIDGFHLLNSFWGEEEGNRFLKFMATEIEKIVSQRTPSVFGRIAGDNFAICMPYDKEFIEAAMETAKKNLADFNRNYAIKPALGVYIIKDTNQPIETMWEFATLAAKECKGKYDQNIAYFKHSMANQMENEQIIVNEMQHALDTEQFVVYLQPKYDSSTEKPYGAEALIRWKHPVKGMIPPGDFIPVFERRGFIGKIDQYMFEHVCVMIRRWLDEGQDPAPISVNISRVNMYNPNLVSNLVSIAKKHKVDPKYISLELTESAYMENPGLLQRTVSELQEAGFTIMMDDFGSGYSSLNTLKDIKVDILKIDMKFLPNKPSNGRNECILASVIRMAGWLKLPVIMEGVENANQVEFLKSIGCGYVQGFFFAKAMPVPEYEQLLKTTEQAPAIVKVGVNQAAIFKTIWSGDPSIDLLFNSINQPAVVYEYANDIFRPLRVNKHFEEFFGYGIDNDASHSSIGKKTSKEDLNRIKKLFKEVDHNRTDSSCDFIYLNENGAQVVLNLQLKYWGTNENSSILFGLFTPNYKE